MSGISLLEIFCSSAMMRFRCPLIQKCGFDLPKRLPVGKTENITESLFCGSTILLFTAVLTMIQPDE